MAKLKNIIDGWIEILTNFSQWLLIIENDCLYMTTIWWRLTSFSSEYDWEEYDRLYEQYVENTK